MNGQFRRRIQREFRSLGGRLWVVILAIAIGVGAVNGVHSLADSIRAAIQDQSRPLMAADFVTQSVHPFPKDYQDLALEYETSQTREMFSMVSSGTYDSVLAEIKGVSGTYPLYGEVELASGKSLLQQLASEKVVVQRSLLKRLKLGVGDTLLVNGERYTIADVVLSESDRVNVGMAAGPRVFLSMDGLERSKLDQFGSRITRRIQWKVKDEGKATLQRALNKLEETHSFVSTQSANRSNPSTARSINNSERFLGVVALMSLLIGTIGVVQSLSNWLASRRKEMAIFRCLGMSRREILQMYVTVVLVLGAGGSLLGIAFSYVGMLALLEIVQPYLPIEISLQPSLWNWLSALMLGVGVSLLSTLPSIVSTTQILASVALQDGTGEQRRRSWYWYGLYGLVLFATLYSQLYNPLWAAAGVATLIVIVGAVYALVMGIQHVLRARRVNNWTLRHAIRNFASTAFGLRTAIVALTLGVMVITSIGLMQHSLTNQIRDVSLTSAPTNFFVDIQPEQWTETKQLLEKNNVSHLQSAPVVMGRIASIKGVPVSEIVADKPDTQRWAYTREQRLSYDVPVNPTTILSGRFDESSPDNALCLETRYAERLGVEVGDPITFDIQGIPVDFIVTATR
ncbi:MAG: ABC transporter permease, partial [Myxococcota bacterium]|nr:ABC transporter permease [Myxococcota bacterium]